MFEKEAEELDKMAEKAYAKDIQYIGMSANITYKLGFKAGYDKANEWHYVKDGDLPKNENRVWLCFGVDDYLDGQFIRGRFWCGSCGWFDVDEVFAWKEIVPPKE